MRNQAARVAPESGSTHVYVSDLAELGAVSDPRYDVSVLRRVLPQPVLEGLRALSRQASIASRYEGSVADFDGNAFVRDVVPGPIAEFLAEDVEALVVAFGATMRKNHVVVSLATVEDDACRKFHADYVWMRMLCTYAGAGTEVLDEPGLDRGAMESHEPFAIANPRIRGTATLFRAGEGDVVMLKGRAFENNGGRGAVHRSPSIRAVGERRLVLKVDTGACGC